MHEDFLFGTAFENAGGVFQNGAGKSGAFWEIAVTGGAFRDGTGATGAFWGVAGTAGASWDGACAAETLREWSRRNGTFREAAGTVDGIFWEGGGCSLCAEPRGLALSVRLGKEQEGAER